MVKLGVVGLRSSKLYGNEYMKNKYYILIFDSMIKYLYKHPEIEEVNIGMSTGISLLMGIAVMQFNKENSKKIKLNCIIPGVNQTNIGYEENEKKIYKMLLENADEKIILSDKPCDGQLYRASGRYISDNSDLILGYWNGHKTGSGTYQAIKFAFKKHIPIDIINPFNPAMRYRYFGV